MEADTRYCRPFHLVCTARLYLAPSPGHSFTVSKRSVVFTLGLRPKSPYPSSICITMQQNIYQLEYAPVSVLTMDATSTSSTHIGDASAGLTTISSDSELSGVAPPATRTPTSVAAPGENSSVTSSAPPSAFQRVFQATFIYNRGVPCRRSFTTSTTLLGRNDGHIVNAS